MTFLNKPVCLAYIEEDDLILKCAYRLRSYKWRGELCHSLLDLRGLNPYESCRLPPSPYHTPVLSLTHSFPLFSSTFCWKWSRSSSRITWNNLEWGGAEAGLISLSLSACGPKPADPLPLSLCVQWTVHPARGTEPSLCLHGPPHSVQEPYKIHDAENTDGI